MHLCFGFANKIFVFAVLKQILFKLRENDVIVEFRFNLFIEYYAAITH